MITMGFIGRSETRRIGGKRSQEAPLIRLDGPWQKRYLSRLPAMATFAGSLDFSRGLAGALCPMDSFERNKIAGAVLFALLVSVRAEHLLRDHLRDRGAGNAGLRDRRRRDAGGRREEAARRRPAQPIAVLLASADPAAGEASAKKCVACHTFGEGEANKVGPNLWEIVNRPIASHEGYEYSRADARLRRAGEDLDLRAPEHLPARPAGHRAGDQDGLPRPEERRRARQRDRLSAHARGKPRAAAAKQRPPSLRRRRQRLPRLRPSGAPPQRRPAAEAPAAAPARASRSRRSLRPPRGRAAGGATRDAAGRAAQPPSRRPPGRAAGGATRDAAGAPRPPPSSRPRRPSSRPRRAGCAAPEQPAAHGTGRRPPRRPRLPSSPPLQRRPPPAAPAGGFAGLVAAGDVAKGQTFAKRCGACHTFEKDGANKVGPHLWGIVDRPIASVADFEYSPAMTAFSAAAARPGPMTSSAPIWRTRRRTCPTTRWRSRA